MTYRITKIHQFACIIAEECYIDGNKYDDQEIVVNNCTTCECKDGIMVCTTIECGNLTCPIEKQIKNSGWCCPICPGDNEISEKEKKKLSRTVMRWP